MGIKSICLTKEGMGTGVGDLPRSLALRGVQSGRCPPITRVYQPEIVEYTFSINSTTILRSTSSAVSCVNRPDLRASTSTLCARL